jgi:hypothetical protein
MSNFTFQYVDYFNERKNVVELYSERVQWAELFEEKGRIVVSIFTYDQRDCWFFKPFFISSIVRASMASKLLGDHERTTEYKDLLHRAGLELFGAPICGLSGSGAHASMTNEAIGNSWLCTTPRCGMMYHGTYPKKCGRCGGTSFIQIPTLTGQE